MPDFEMIVIDGVRYRPEDAPARPAEPEAPAALFDPGEHTVAEVLAHLADAADAERVRVLAAELADKARKGILEAPAETGGGGGAAS
ncbi:hypothetical protein [Streptomyces sp. LS1784]|uniref:hypothetical protein n=1 Tax=Streptomyces sp. LS1784 TaxID=2851533 RepID=UPI001CCAC902|nr:hypothetical protein [Streptomyces sp. LS1784]